MHGHPNIGERIHWEIHHFIPSCCVRLLQSTLKMERPVVKSKSSPTYEVFVLTTNGCHYCIEGEPPTPRMREPVANPDYGFTPSPSAAVLMKKRVAQDESPDSSSDDNIVIKKKKSTTAQPVSASTRGKICYYFVFKFDVLTYNL